MNYCGVRLDKVRGGGGGCYGSSQNGDRASYLGCNGIDLEPTVQFRLNGNVGQILQQGVFSRNELLKKIRGLVLTCTQLKKIGLRGLNHETRTGFCVSC
jgi:hypothetical protein